MTEPSGLTLTAGATVTLDCEDLPTGISAQVRRVDFLLAHLDITDPRAESLSQPGDWRTMRGFWEPARTAAFKNKGGGLPCVLTHDGRRYVGSLTGLFYNADDRRPYASLRLDEFTEQGRDPDG